MAFKKAEKNFPFLKICLFGNTGSGKTCTALKLGRGLAGQKRVALIDTDPQALSSLYAEQFDFDSAHPLNIEALEAEVASFDTNQYGVLVVDTITWFWRSLMDANDVRKTARGTVSFGEWDKIKRVFRDCILRLMNLEAHVIVTAREAIDYDMTSGEYTPVGYKASAEKDMPYEFSLLIRSFLGRGLGEKLDGSGHDVKRNNFCEIIRDRSNTFPPRHTFINMDYKDIEPIVAKLGGIMVKEPLASEEAVANQAIFSREKQAVADLADKSAKLKIDMEAKILNAKNKKALKEITEVIKAAKREFTEEDIEFLRGKAKEKQASFQE